MKNKQLQQNINKISFEGFSFDRSRLAPDRENGRPMKKIGNSRKSIDALFERVKTENTSG